MWSDGSVRGEDHVRIAITGGTGYIGGAVARLLTARGHEVLIARRGTSSDPMAWWDPAAGWVRPGAFAGFDAVLSFGGVSIAHRWSAARQALLRSSRIDATRLLARHLAALPEPPTVYVSASAAGLYGNRDEPRLTEDAARGEGFLATLVADWEAAAEPARARGIRVVHARFGASIARDGELLRRLLPPFRLGLGGPIGNGRQWFSWVTIEDAASAVAFAVEHATLAGPVNVVAPNPVTNAEFTRELARVLHRPAFMPLPAFAVRLLFGRGLADEMLLGGQAAYPQRLLDAGFTFAHPTMRGALAAHLS